MPTGTGRDLGGTGAGIIPKPPAAVIVLERDRRAKIRGRSQGIPTPRGGPCRCRPWVGRRRHSTPRARLEDLAVEMYARGLSTRDIEAALCDDQGHPLPSRTAVSQVTERLWEEYEAFATC